MVTDPDPGDIGLTDSGDDLAARAVSLARRWVAESAEIEVDPAAARLAGVLKDPHGLPFTIGFVDGVMRPESLMAAASQLSRVAPLVPGFLPWYLRGAVRVGGAIAPVLPSPIVPIARRVLRDMVGHLVVDARPDKLGPAIEALRGSGARLNLNLLGEAVLGEQEALRRLEGIHELIRRPDVDYVSVKVSAIASRISMWAFDDVVDEVVERLLPLYLTARGPSTSSGTGSTSVPEPVEGSETGSTFINLDMEEYRDLDLTIAVFRRLLDDPRLRGLEAGIVIQAYLPDALPALEGLTAWAQRRVASGGARIKVRLVKGANLAMERVDAVMHGWSLATYDAKLDSDANYVRCLDFALRPESAAAVRVGVAGHNLFDIAYAWLLAQSRSLTLRQAQGPESQAQGPESQAQGPESQAQGPESKGRPDVDVEMLLGMAQGQVAAVAREVGSVLLYVPVVRPDEFDVAISYLVRRLEENASSDNFLSAAFELAVEPAMFDRERDRFLASLERAADPSLPTGRTREQDRSAVVDEPPIARARPRGAGDADDEAGLTQAVLGIARSAAADPADTTPVAPSAAEQLFAGEAYVETAVFAPRESADRPAGAPGFRNAPDTDPALPANRAWAGGVLARIHASRAGDATIAAARVDDVQSLDDIVRRVTDAGARWGAKPAAERGTVLASAARALEARRGELIEAAASETGKVFAEADVEVSEAVDFANYYAATARELDRVSGAVFEPARLTVVAPPWNFPIAIPAGGVLAALAAGSGVVLKPAPQARRCAAVVAEALWDAGIPRDLLVLVDIDEDRLGQGLIAHPGVDRVILTGSWETAALFRSWRPELPLLAETSGKNAMIVMPSADLDLAASDLVKSAFGHAGQKCSAASLAILVGPVGHSKRFARQLVDATRSLRVGPPTDPRSEVGPVIEPPHGKLEWALTTLDAEEKWLVEPALRQAQGPGAPGQGPGAPGQGPEEYRSLSSSKGHRPGEQPEFAGRLWTPGIRTGVMPGSRFHHEEFFGPVLGIMHTHSLAQAIELQNAVAYGLTAGLHTQDPDDLAVWLDHVEAGNLYVNRGITGAIVQRQPFGGWKHSSVGPGAKAGGPNYLIGLGSWRATSGSTASATLHLRGLDSRITSVIEAAQPSLDYESFEWLRRAALSDAIAWDREFGQVKDVSGLRIERNLFRYRSMPQVVVRATADASWQSVLRVMIAGIRAGSDLTLSAGVGFPAAVRRALTDLDVDVFVETDEQWLQRMVAPKIDMIAAAAGEASLVRPPRVRLIGSRDAVAALHSALSTAIGGDPGLAVYDNEVTTAGRLELLPFLHEQSITITAHRFGTPDPWSEDVI